MFTKVQENESYRFPSEHEGFKKNFIIHYFNWSIISTVDSNPNEVFDMFEGGI